MARKLNPFSGRQFLDANGDPYSGAQLFVYLAGTSTKETLTKDQAGASNHANPIILNTRGEPADGAGASQSMWQTDGVSTKLVLAPSTDTDPPVSAISTWDDLEGINDTSVSGGGDEWILGGTPTFVSTTSLTLVGDVTTAFHPGRRIKTTNSGGTIYSTIQTSVFTTLTTLVVINDSGVLDSGISAVSYGILASTNRSEPVSKGVDIASASTITIGTDGRYFDITGTTTITAINSVGVGTVVKLQFDGVLTLTHHATNLILPGAANITTAAGDECELVEYASGDWRCTSYSPAAAVLQTHDHTSGAGALIPIGGLATAIKPWIQIEQVVAAGETTISFESLDTSTYNRYMVKIDTLEQGSDNADLYMLVGTGGTPTYQTANYDYMNHYGDQADVDDTYTRTNAASVAQMVLNGKNLGSQTTESYDGTVEFTNPENAALYTRFIWDAVHSDNANLLTFTHGVGAWGVVTAVTAIQFKMSTGTLGTGGTFTLYGLRT